MTEPTLPQKCRPVQNSFPRFRLSMKGSTGVVVWIVILSRRLKQPDYLNMVFGHYKLKCMYKQLLHLHT
jgi:hypothetical protein